MFSEQRLAAGQTWVLFSLGISELNGICICACLNCAKEEAINESTVERSYSPNWRPSNGVGVASSISYG